MTENQTLTGDEWALWDLWTNAQRVFAKYVEGALQREFDISKAEFSVMVTLHRATRAELRVGDLAEALAWDKSRVSHLLTRMETRGFVSRIESGAAGRRTGISLTPNGRRVAQAAITVHAGTIRRYFLDQLSLEQTAAIRAWSEHLVVSENAGHDEG
jgi:DNA-binding MarR family transcriptional regulator